MLDENTTNFQGQKSLNYEFSTLEKVASEQEDVKSSLGSLKLWNVNRLIFGQININSIRNEFELLFSLVSNNIDVWLISEKLIIHISCRMLSKFTFEKEIEPFAIEIDLRKVKWLLACSYNPKFCNLPVHLNAIAKAIAFYSKTYDKILIAGNLMRK